MTGRSRLALLQRFSHLVLVILLGLSLTLNLHLFNARVSRSNQPASSMESESLTELDIFMIIGTAPENVERRQELRRTWLRWLDPRRHQYRFFTDHPDTLSNQTALALHAEQSTHGDLVYTPTPPGRRGYGHRGLWAYRYAHNAKAAFVVRTDDDSFICFPTLARELRVRPRRRFMWGKYWFRKGNAEVSWLGRNRMDENLIILSADIVSFIAQNHEVLAFDGDATMAVNLAFWSHFMNLTVFDDRDRMDTQQHYLTDYMHQPVDETVKESGGYGRFCEGMWYSHRVHPGVMAVAYEQASVSAMLDIEVPPIQPPRTEGYAFETIHFTRKLPNCSCYSLVHPQ